MASESDIRAILTRALDADEAGRKDEAINLYGQAVEQILRLDDREKKDKLSKFAKQALDRAEELKGIKYTGHNPVPGASLTPTASNPVVRSSANLASPSRSGPTLAISGSKHAYTNEEKKVLEHTSHINAKVYVPFMDIDLVEKFHFPMPYTDKDGYLELAPKQKRDFVSWVRVSELSENPQLIVGDHADFYSIRQTVVSDCSFVASLAVASQFEKKFKRRILTSIIYPRNSKDEPVYNPSGKYSIRMHVNGIPRKVVIDDYLPLGRYNQLLCSYSSNKNEFWVSLLEKAYMKLMGGYDFPGSNSNIDLHALTGWIPERALVKSSEPDFNADAVFARLQEGLSMGRCLVTVATGELSDAEAERTGLVSTHAYAVLDMRVVDGVKLLQLKNPWSHLRWRGNYSELDVIHWTSELQRTLGYDPKLAATYDNGVFWIDYPSIINFFDVFYLNWDPSLFQYTYCIHQSWSAGVGPTKDAYNVGDNPQFSLTVPAGRGSVWILLTRHITSIEDFRENHEYITVLVYNSGGKRVYYPTDPPPYIDGVRINSPHYLCKIRLDPNSERRYTLVVSQYEKTATIYYSLRAYSRTKFELKQLGPRYQTVENLNGEWKGKTAGGCPNHPLTYKNNPLYRLHIGPADMSDLVIELRGPKVYQVGLELTVASLEDSTVTAPFVAEKTGVYRSGFCVLDLANIPAGVYHVRPSTFLPEQESPFFLKVKSTTNVVVEKLN
ncbi:calpain-7-like [Anopheles ziemanni]|uniref:calpain-7-like n=1 Tax=Anopheles coustani TaxID=139045 RepID=UPI0026591396|nr:calpain-7-like [Anopheles coustani]XP_058171919.1 calpain-7-like [Anopheles ziemanni]